MVIHLCLLSASKRGARAAAPLSSRQTLRLNGAPESCAVSAISWWTIRQPPNRLSSWRHWQNRRIIVYFTLTDEGRVCVTGACVTSVCVLPGANSNVRWVAFSFQTFIFVFTRICRFVVLFLGFRLVLGDRACETAAARIFFCWNPKCEPQRRIRISEAISHAFRPCAFFFPQSVPFWDCN